MQRVYSFMLIFVLTAMLSPFSAQAKKAISVQDLGGYHIGGNEVQLKGLPVEEKALTPGGPVRKLDPNGEFEAGQMYVQYVHLESPKAKYPLLLWHGGGLTGATWENTPDGRDGWQMYFLRQGHNVYISDAVERGRASWAKFPEINTTAPVFRSKQDAWRIFRFGPTYDKISERKPFAGQLFPVDKFDQFMKGSVPRWTSSNAWILKAYGQYVSSFKDGCVIVAHSQSANFALTTALAHANNVKGLIILEGSGAPKVDGTDFASIKHIPQLHIWGDYMEESPIWQKYQVNVKAFADASKKAGASVTWIALPEIGIKGNSHMIYQDKNSDDIAALVQKWMQEQGLMK